MAAYPQWISDGSPEIQIDSATQVQCIEGSSTGNVFNALWKEVESANASTGTHYWKVTFLDGKDGPWIGLTDIEKFKKGWGLRGLMYGGPGNLSDGGGLLVGSYGPGVSSGDTVGMLVKLDNESIKIYFDLNGKPLGLAFDVPRSTLCSEVFPVVHFNGPCKAKIERSQQVPANLDRQEPNYEGIEGDWKLISYSGTNSEHLTPNLQISKMEEGNTFSVFLKVLNNISFQLVRDSAGNWTTGDNRISTMMGGRPEDMKFENDMNNLTTNPGKVEVGDDGNLTIAKGDLVSKWTRYSTAKDPVKTNPFTR